MKDKQADRLYQAAITTVKQQLAENDPPQTREALMRLAKQGFNQDQALDMVATLVLQEMILVVTSGQQYDHQRYLTALNRLPVIDKAHYTH